MSEKAISASEVPGFEKLTLKEQAFVLHPDVFRDPKKAALEVGYSSSTIEKRAHSMRQRLMRFIQPRFVHELAQLGVDRRRIEEELACSAFVDITEFMESIDIEMPDGGFQSVAVWKDPASLPSHMRRAIKHVEYGFVTDAEGNQHQSDRPITVILHSKEKALKELAGLFGDVAPKNPEDEQHELLENLSPKERETIVRLYTIAARRAADKTTIEGDHVESPPVRKIEARSDRSDGKIRNPDRRLSAPRDKPRNAPVPPPNRRVDRARTPDGGAYVPLDHGDDDNAGYEDPS